MSYPRQIRTLIVEDDDRPKAFYDTLFATLSDVAPPRYAFCYEDAKKALKEPAIFHFVILDLGLPERPGQPPSDQLEFGLAILGECINRNDYPIPGLLIISGQLGKAANQIELEAKVRNGFAYGRIVTKGSSGNEEEIKQAIHQINCYCDVGVHVQDAHEKVFPTLSPREEDLLRRCALEQKQCGGVDLKWWSAEFAAPTGSFANYKGWNKILMGRFLSSETLDLSRAMFFKLFPAGGSEVVLQDVQMLQRMLRHIKVLSGLSTGDRSLLATEKIGSSNADPIPLDDFLGQSTTMVQPVLPEIVHEIAQQLAELGNVTPNQLPLKDVLWEHHDEDRLRHLLRQYSIDNVNLPVDEEEVVRMLSILRKNQTVIRIEQRVCHGDLNLTNVALDGSKDGIHAYVIDPSGMRMAVNVWDFAMLEITSLLHQSLISKESLVSKCGGLFASLVEPSGDLNFSTEVARIGNTLKLISEIRGHALQLADSKIYALMLFNAALIQVGGLAFRSINKIQNPADAILLASQTANLLRGVAPGWLV